MQLRFCVAESLDIFLCVVLYGIKPFFCCQSTLPHVFSSKLIFYTNDQLISSLFLDFKKSLAPEKHFELKNLVTENGEG